MVFQDYALFPHLTVAENVGFGLPRKEGCPRAGPARRRRFVRLYGRFTARALGGQQQRVALARNSHLTELVLLDEPWSNIDPSSASRCGTSWRACSVRST